LLITLRHVLKWLGTSETPVLTWCNGIVSQVTPIICITVKCTGKIEMLTKITVEYRTVHDSSHVFA